MYNFRSPFTVPSAFSKINSNVYMNSNRYRNNNSSSYHKKDFYDETNSQIESGSSRNNHVYSQGETEHTSCGSPYNVINVNKYESKSEHESNESRGINNLFQLNTDEVLFEILGLKIYIDDLLIVCILLFLYQEGIQDEFLFISLILLLLN